MITLKQAHYHKKDYIFLYTLVEIMVRDVQDECKHRKRNCENCEYKIACKDLESLNHYLKKKTFEN